MRRGQHDAADKNLQTQLSELDKVNPLDKHYAEAQRIKSELSKTIGSQAENLATQGFSNSTTSDIYRTNRTIGDLYSPTGKLGQMNAAKTIFDKEKETYLTDAVNVSKIGRAQALKNWEKHVANNYTGYSEDGKNITNISGLGAPAAQDYEKDRANYKSLLGSTTKSAKASGYQIVPSGLATGEMMMVDQKGNRVQSDNITQLNSAKLGMKNKWINATGEGRVWADAAGWDPNETEKRIDLDFGTMRETSDVDNRYTDHSIISGSGTPAKDTIETPTGTPFETKEIGATESDYNSISRIGQNRPSVNVVGSPLMMGTGGGGYETKNKGKFSHNDIPDPMMKARYKAIFNRLFKAGKIQHKIDNPYSAKMVMAEMKKDGPITLSSSVIRTDSELNSLGFANKLVAKDAKGRDAQIIRELQQPLRKLIDPITGKSTTYNEMIDKGYQMGKTQYFGYVSPHNWMESKFENGDMAPHIITVFDKEGHAHSTQMSKIAGDETPREKRAGKVINATYRSATIAPNSSVKIESDNPKFKGSTVSYNTRSKAGQPVSEPYWTITIPGEGARDLTESEYIKFMNTNID
jgi:hypothetical protein